MRQRAHAQARKQAIGASLPIRRHVYALLAREPPTTTVVDGAAAFVVGDADEQALEAAILQATRTEEEKDLRDRLQPVLERSQEGIAADSQGQDDL